MCEYILNLHMFLSKANLRDFWIFFYYLFWILFKDLDK